MYLHTHARARARAYIYIDLFLCARSIRETKDHLFMADFAIKHFIAVHQIYPIRKRFRTHWGF